MLPFREVSNSRFQTFSDSNKQRGSEFATIGNNTVQLIRHKISLVKGITPTTNRLLILTLKELAKQLTKKGQAAELVRLPLKEEATVARTAPKSPTLRRVGAWSKIGSLVSGGIHIRHRESHPPPQIILLEVHLVGRPQIDARIGG